MKCKKITKTLILDLCRDQELTKKVCKQIGGRFWEILENCEYYYNNPTKTKGFVSDEEINKFFKKNSIIIINVLKYDLLISFSAFDNIVNLLCRYSLKCVMLDIIIAKKHLESKGYK